MPLITLPPIDQLKPQIYVEARERFERRTNRDFDIAVSDNRSDLFSRWRVGAKLGEGQKVRGEIRYQYAHDTVWTKARNFSTENSDLDLAYVETDIEGWIVDLGRQKINIGQQRLIGSFEWNNVGRSFDALRIRNKQWDAFAFKIGVGSSKPRDARVVGLVHLDKRAGDTMYAFKHDKGVDIHTLDHLIVKPLGIVTLDAEAAIQAGRVGGKDHRAWALHARGTVPVSAKVKAFAEVNAASGGSSPTENRTFDNLYPTNHAKYGIADMIAWKNMRHVAVGADVAVRKGLNARVSWNTYSLQDPRDAWYGAGGAPNTHSGAPLRDPAGASGRYLGDEYDLDLTYAVSKTATLSAGVAVFKPGSFVRTVAGSADEQVWGYLQFGTRF